MQDVERLEARVDGLLKSDNKLIEDERRERKLRLRLLAQCVLAIEGAEALAAALGDGHYTPFVSPLIVETRVQLQNEERDVVMRHAA